MISLEDIDQPDFLAGNDKPVRDSVFLYILFENFLLTSVDIFKPKKMFSNLFKFKV